MVTYTALHPQFRIVSHRLAKLHSFYKSSGLAWNLIHHQQAQLPEVYQMSSPY
jgi:hypothetical protein